MAPEIPTFVPYPPIAACGVIGDRRTAALIASDGTLNWLCLPDYDGTPFFAALLDTGHGGYWRFGPREPLLGLQRYEADGAVLVSEWEGPNWRLELTDAMAWPEDRRPRNLEHQHAILRRLRCTEGEVECALAFSPRDDFGEGLDASSTAGIQRHAGRHAFNFWSTLPQRHEGDALMANSVLHAGDTHWCVFEYPGATREWNSENAEALLGVTRDYWSRWLGGLRWPARPTRAARRSAMVIHLLTYAPTGAVIASPTASLPARIGGQRNYDYRYSWIRDASLAMAILARLGAHQDAKRYFDWLVGLKTDTDQPLQVLYGIRGEHDAPLFLRIGVTGYRHSAPIRFGNPAAGMRETDSLGYLADCVLTYLACGGPWEDRYWPLIRSIAEHAAATWQRPDSSIWELPQQHYVVSKVMSWVAIDRALKIAQRVGRVDEISALSPLREHIRSEVLDRGWNEQHGFFRQHYGADVLDSAALLIPLVGFLPPDDPRVNSTISWLERSLSINGLMHRFHATQVPEQGELLLGEFEGAFLMCTAWLATLKAQTGDHAAAARLLNRIDAASNLGLLSECMDARSDQLLGNYPLVFSHAEYLQAFIAVYA